MQPTTVLDPARAQALRWASRATLDAVQQRLRPAVDRWAAGWGIVVEAVLADNDVPDDVARPAGAPWGRAEPGQEAIAPLHVALFGEPPDRIGGRAALASAVARAAWADLLEHLSAAAAGAHRAAAAAAGDPAAAAKAVGARGRWSGGVRLRIALACTGWPAGDLVLALDAALVATLCPPATPKIGARPTIVVPLAEALAARPLRLTVRLAPVTLDLGSLQTLAVGDVIALPHPVDEPAAVELEVEPAGAALPLCAAHLAQRGGRRAIELMPTPNASNS